VHEQALWTYTKVAIVPPQLKLLCISTVEFHKAPGSVCLSLSRRLQNALTEYIACCLQPRALELLCISRSIKPSCIRSWRHRQRRFQKSGRGYCSRSHAGQWISTRNTIPGLGTEGTPYTVFLSLSMPLEPGIYSEARLICPRLKAFVRNNDG
jgi:hypothetical protein